jgi:hypothetical protein
MFIVTNGKAELTPFRVTYEKTVRKLVSETREDAETGEYVPAVFEKEQKETRCWFADAEKATAYAEEVGGTVEDLTPAPGIVAALEHMTFVSFEEARAFIEDGVEPPEKLTTEGLAEVMNAILGVADNG